MDNRGYIIETKYPRYRIIGDSVNPQLAAEILARTSVDVLEIDSDITDRVANPLPLSILRNHLFTGGPSWMSTDGRFNDGVMVTAEKWPEWGDLITEAELLAEAFPTLFVMIELFEETESGVYRPINRAVTITVDRGSVTAEINRPCDYTLPEVRSHRVDPEGLLQSLGW